MKVVAPPYRRPVRRGSWLSEDGRWHFMSASREYDDSRKADWHIRAASVKRMPTFEQDDQFLRATGLSRARFKTRKQAVATLELLLSGSSIPA